MSLKEELTALRSISFLGTSAHATLKNFGVL